MRRLAGLLAAGVLAVGLTACGSDDAKDAGSPSGSTDPSTSAPASSGPGGAGGAAPTGGAVPEAGVCYDLSAEELERASTSLSTAAAGIDCSGPHNAVTVEVLGLSDGLVALLDGPASTGSVTDPATAQRVALELTGLCLEPTQHALGAVQSSQAATGVWSGRASTISAYAWLPSAQQWADGDRWVRCDLANSLGAPLPDGAPPFQLDPVPAAYAKCFIGSVEGFIPVDCSAPDANAQAVASIHLTPDAVRLTLEQYASFQPKADTMCGTYAGGIYGAEAVKGVQGVLPEPTTFVGEISCYLPYTPGAPLLATE